MLCVSAGSVSLAGSTTCLKVGSPVLHSNNAAHDRLGGSVSCCKVNKARTCCDRKKWTVTRPCAGWSKIDGPHVRQPELSMRLMAAILRERINRDYASWSTHPAKPMLDMQICMIRSGATPPFPPRMAGRQERKLTRSRSISTQVIGSLEHRRGLRHYRQHSVAGLVAYRCRRSEQFNGSRATVLSIFAQSPRPYMDATRGLDFSGTAAFRRPLTAEEHPRGSNLAAD